MSKQVHRSIVDRERSGSQQDRTLIGWNSRVRIVASGRRILAGCLVAVVLLTAFGITGIGRAQSPSVAPVVKPNDIATPTSLPSYIPTVTPTPMDAVVPSNSISSAIPNSISSAPVMNMMAAEQSVTGGSSYTVREGDTLWSVSIEIGIDLDDVPCLIGPDFRITEPLVIGNRIEVPSGEITCYQVLDGDTLASVAEEYHLNPEQLISDEWNELAEDDAIAELTPGSYVRFIQQSLPEDSNYLGFVLQRPITETPQTTYGTGGPSRASSEALVPENWPYGSGYFEWPAYGWISQGFRGQHRAIDIAATLGSIITSADRGVVIRAGWNNNGYGNFVVVDHNIDYITLYAHLDRILVEEGEVVAKGQALGTVGSTGNSTGPHLHFEVRDFGARVDPLGVLVH